MISRRRSCHWSRRLPRRERRARGDSRRIGFAAVPPSGGGPTVVAVIEDKTRPPDPPVYGSTPGHRDSIEPKGFIVRAIR